MKNIKKTLFILGILSITNVTHAQRVSVPMAPGQNYILVSSTTGAYFASTSAYLSNLFSNTIFSNTSSTGDSIVNTALKLPYIGSTQILFVGPSDKVSGDAGATFNGLQMVVPSLSTPELCLTGNCKSAWPSGVSGGAIGMPTVWVTPTTLGASSSPTFGYIFATSTTKTSYIANKLGIGTTTSAFPLNIQGNATSSGGTDNFRIADNLGTLRFSVNSSGGISIFDPTYNGTPMTLLSVSENVHSLAPVSTEIPTLNWDLSAGTITHQTGNMARDARVLFKPDTVAFSGASTITNLATIVITGAPALGANTIATNNHALLIQSANVGTQASSTYGLTVNAQSGGTSNYASQFLGGNVGIGTSTPTVPLTVYSTDGNNPSAQFVTAHGFTSGFVAIADLASKVNSTVSDLSGPSLSYSLGVSNALPALIGQIGFGKSQGNNAWGDFIVKNGTNGGVLTRMVVSNVGNMAVGTATPAFKIEAAGVVPTLALTETSAATNAKHWVFAASGNNLVLSTTTDVFATTTSGIMQFTRTGQVSIGTTSAASLFNVGSSTVVSSSMNIAPGLTPTQQRNGDVWVATTTQTLDSFIGNIWGSAGRVIFTGSADAVITNTNVDTSAIPSGIGTTSLPANFWTPGKTVHIHGQGLYALPIGGGSATIKIKYGATTLASKTTSGLLANATNLQWWFDADVTCRTVGTAGTVVISGQVSYSSNAATNIAVSDPIQTTNGSAVTIDTTSANLLDVTVAFDTAATTKIATTTIATYEVKN